MKSCVVLLGRILKADLAGRYTLFPFLPPSPECMYNGWCSSSHLKPRSNTEDANHVKDEAERYMELGSLMSIRATITALDYTLWDFY